LGATDGHAKNVSVFLLSGGRFGMTPFYDVLSAQPAVDAGQLRRNRFRLSMAVGENRHYTIDSIFPRHFLQTALIASIGASITEALFEELATTVPRALEETLAGLPMGFPSALATSVCDGVLDRLRRLETSWLVGH
jgi:serine/threonine-protein kinase HipA